MAVAKSLNCGVLGAWRAVNAGDWQAWAKMGLWAVWGVGLVAGVAVIV